MPDMAGQKMAIGTRHRFAPLKRAFCYRKGASKSWNRAYITDLHLWIKELWWSDPYLLKKKTEHVLQSTGKPL